MAVGRRKWLWQRVNICIGDVNAILGDMARVGRARRAMAEVRVPLATRLKRRLSSDKRIGWRSISKYVARAKA